MILDLLAGIIMFLIIYVLVIYIVRTTQEIYHNFKFDKMIQRTDEDIDRLVKERLKKRKVKE